MPVRVGAIIVAAGRGERIGATRPKQLLDLGGTTMLQRSVAAFASHPAVAAIVVVLPPDRIADGPAIVGRAERVTAFAAGGARRQDSVANGLAAMAADVDVMLVHDAARPFVSAAVIDRVIDATVQAGAAVPAIPVHDTVKRSTGSDRTIVATIPRGEIWLAQTPQGFRREILQDAMARGGGADVTDEAMLVERAGYAVRIVDGDESNMKITTLEDLDRARARLGSAIRVGTGYDLHRLEHGRSLVLAGVVLPFEKGPAAHSDGDVVCHALVDAMLGAAGLADIGQQFPNTELAWKDAAGLDLLVRSRQIVAASGWVVANADVTVVLERPKLSPHLAGIRSRLAEALGISPDAVSVKGKTNEGVDAVGRGEAIAAHAVVALRRAELV